MSKGHWGVVLQVRILYYMCLCCLELTFGNLMLGFMVWIKFWYKGKEVTCCVSARERWCIVHVWHVWKGNSSLAKD